MDADVLVLSAARTAIGRYNGALRAVPPSSLAAAVTREALTRASVGNEEVSHVVFGNVIHTEPKDMYLSRVAAIEGGLPETVPALTLNRLCGSGLEAILAGARMIRLGDADIVLAGGAESMSRAPHSLVDYRWGHRLGNGELIDMMVGALTDPFSSCHMGQTAENLARRFDISRDDQDALALESHKRATSATVAGLFRDQIVAIESRDGSAPLTFDEHVRPEIDAEQLSRLKPAFDHGGTVTAGNSSGINDAAAAVVMASRHAVERGEYPVLGRLISYAHCGVDPQHMGIGPVVAVPMALKRARLSLEDMAVIELNEAFAAQALAVQRQLGMSRNVTNPNGGAIALGHPIGATGCILVVKLLHELRRIGRRYGMVTLCVGGGQGVAAIFENELGT